MRYAINGERWIELGSVGKLENGEAIAIVGVVKGAYSRARELVRLANWALAHRAEHAAMAAAIKGHRDGFNADWGGEPFASGTSLGAQEHQALLAALPPEAAAEPLTITVPPDTAGEIVAMLTKVANLLEKGGDRG